jgi:hypothetical protein
LTIARRLFWIVLLAFGLAACAALLILMGWGLARAMNEIGHSLH